MCHARSLDEIWNQIVNHIKKLLKYKNMLKIKNENMLKLKIIWNIILCNYLDITNKHRTHIIYETITIYKLCSFTINIKK